MNLYARFEETFRRAGDDPALICPQREDWSHACLANAVARTAGALAECGVRAGDRVLVQVEKTPEAVALYLACLKTGAVYVPINTAYTPAEVRYFIKDAEPALFVARAKFDARVRVETLDGAGQGSFAALVAAAEPFTLTVGRADDDIAAIVYTSGTTGRSKGAMLAHANLASNAETLCACWGWQDDDVLLHALPIFHVHGLFVALHCAFLTGTPTIFLPGFEAVGLLRELPRATVLMGVPTFYTRLLNQDGFDAAACRNMRLFISGSAPLAEQTFAAFEQRTGMRILERYGMSETLMNASNPLHGERVAGSVGFALPGVEVRIADADGRVLPPGQVGGIEVRGPNVFKGYWRMPAPATQAPEARQAPAAQAPKARQAPAAQAPEARQAPAAQAPKARQEKTAAEFRADGFFMTGDLGTMDAAGRLAIVGRAKDLVISGGYNVYPKEVEARLDEMPEVAESAVIGVPHTDFGEAVVAVVVAEAVLDLGRVDAFLKGRLARYKQPKRLVCVDDLPRNAMGKVQKNVLRKIYRDIFSANR